ncbi:PIN domain-containing protein [Candidatus Poribacteria bacterium]|nr:PIN domain-containing protein [Candidatus Poribacteria bacterium]
MTSFGCKLTAPCRLFEIIVVTPTERIKVIEQDPDDNRILECAVEGNVNYIVSGDRHLLNLGRYRGIEIITISEFLLLTFVLGNKMLQVKNILTL